MAEAVAAFYAVETAVEGAAVGAYAASKPTVPLHVRFRQLVLPKSSDSKSSRTRVGHTFDVVKGKGYVIGGDAIQGEPDSNVQVVTLPSSLENNEVDYQIVEPKIASERPLQPYSAPGKSSLGSQTEIEGSEKTASSSFPVPRAEHTSAVIDSTIYVLSGQESKRHQDSSLLEKSSGGKLYDCNLFDCFSTQTNTWSSLKADVGRCPDGIPQPRTRASCTSIPHPQPGTGVEVTATAHGTIFLHGGYDSQGSLLRDTWSFDVSSRAWRRWPDVPEPLPQEVAGEGRISIQGNRLCRVGDGFGKVMFMDIEIVEGDVVHAASGPHNAEIAVKPQSTTWEVVSFGVHPEQEPVGKSESLPVPRYGAGFVPITTGAGRLYNLYFMGQDGPESAMRDIWSLQVKAENKSLAAIKDRVRTAVGKGSGENQWALCEVAESSKQDGPLERPQGLYDFASDAWSDFGGAHVIIWGGKDSNGMVRDGGWLLSAE